ncbi:uncharacterized protein LOC109823331 [Asparagus officinalis]|uniref:uncharacterized protein LOC109823331 n=1 Tax=Asparagus officinalis TaxID=4686 RepID=UPI00098DF342|nr:uncharacterized protein LOC109823331 [Asparagus officinalis]
MLMLQQWHVDLGGQVGTRYEASMVATDSDHKPVRYSYRTWLPPVEVSDKGSALVQEIIKELMERLPHMKEFMDMYCGPDRVTAKQQIQELDRVAKTLQENIPSSVKRFTYRAVLSLQVFFFFQLSLVSCKSYNVQCRLVVDRKDITFGDAN